MMAPNVMNHCNLLIVEDETITRTTLVHSLMQQYGQDHVFEAANGQQALEQLHTYPLVDTVLLDLKLPDMNGLQLVGDIKEEFGSQVKIIILTGTDDTETVCAALAAGVNAYYTKGIHLSHLLRVIELVNEGAICFDPSISQSILDRFPILNAEYYAREKRFASNITNRERDVLVLLTKGFSNKEIAENLNLSVNTVKTHVQHLIDKLSVDSRTQLAIKAIDMQTFGEL